MIYGRAAGRRAEAGLKAIAPDRALAAAYQTEQQHTGAPSTRRAERDHDRTRRADGKSNNAPDECQLAEGATTHYSKERITPRLKQFNTNETGDAK